MTPDPTAPATSRAEFDQRQAESRAAYSAKLDELAANVKAAIEEHQAASRELNRARNAAQALREERDNHLERVLAKIDRRAELIPEQFQTALKATARRIAGSSHRAAALPATAELAVWLKPDLSLNAKRIEAWKAAVTEAAEGAGAISTRAVDEIEAELAAANEAAEAAQGAEREAHDAVAEARRAARELGAAA